MGQIDRQIDRQREERERGRERGEEREKLQAIWHFDKDSNLISKIFETRVMQCGFVFVLCVCVLVCESTSVCVVFVCVCVCVCLFLCVCLCVCLQYTSRYDWRDQGMNRLPDKTVNPQKQSLQRFHHYTFVLSI